MLHLRLKLISTAFVALVGVISVFGTGNNVPEPWNYDSETVVDTIPLTDNYDNSIYDSSTNPFDLKPSNIVQTAEYDPVTGNYVIYEKIGEEYFRTPTVMTFEEYVEWQNKENEKRYFQELAGINTEYKSSSGIVDPISKIDIQDNLVDRLFGGTGVDLQPQGNIDLTFGGDYQKIQNPNIPLRNQTNGGFDFDMDIKMNVDGTIGKKMKLGFNYDTQATFDFDRKIKLEYDTEAFSEDDIIKKLEAGNVSLPLRSSLIQGAQSLFGLKTELQFGKLRLTGIASQQKSKNESLNIQNGSSVQEFEIRPDEYDENRHFFLSHYHRDTYERTLSNLPYLNTPLRINNIQVWISDDRADYQQNSTQVCFISDLAEPNADKFSNKEAFYEPLGPIFPDVYIGADGLRLPDNNVNTLYRDGGNGIVNDQNVRRKDMTSSLLKTSPYNLTQTRDFEVQRGRLLSRSEYSFTPELGFISLNVRLKPNQVLGVAYEYFYTENCDTLYSVGELSQDAVFSDTNEEGEVEPASVLFVKMLKSSNQRIDNPNWDLMMKNVYPLRTNTLDQNDFEFDIFFEDDANGTLVKFLPFEGAESTPLLNLFQLDRLNSFGDPQPDGVFDFVPGVTVIPSSGSMVFPVLEPFGSSIDDLLAPLGIPQTAIDSFKFNELYDTTVTIARQMLEKNKFVMKGKVKSSSSSEISLGAWNIPQGSVRVTAGGDPLTEGVDYEIDYGIGRIRIINQAYLQSGVPIRVSYEDNSVFSLQQKTMLGLRADYEVNDKLALGATYLRLFERPFTEKVNVGDDPINNRIFGADLTYGTESQGITRLIDKLPFYSTNETSTFNFSAEVAALKPGHSGAINLSDQEGGVVSIDDFEGAVSGFPLGSQANRWFLASTPVEFPEGELVDDLAYGANRALLNWYTIDRTGRNTGDNEDPYSRLIQQDEIFDRDIPAGQLRDLFTFDLSYYPEKRGPYNFDEIGGTAFSAGIDPNSQNEIKLLEPETRWGGIMRYFNNSDFQAANYEVIEFWLLDPFMEDGGNSVREKDHLDNEAGKIVFHLGNVSEDILNDNQQFYENTIPVNGEEGPSASTVWGEIPLNSPTNNAFDLNNRDDQDLGLDGLNNAAEREKYDAWIQNMQGGGIDPGLMEDPSNDDFIYFLNENEYNLETSTLFERYSRFNGPEGNAPDGSANERGNPFPDTEDLNSNYSLDEGENYYKYEVELIRENGTFTPDGQRYYKDFTEGANGERWYQFQIPINEVTDSNTVGQIQGFRSIQFIRMLVEGFSTAKTFRFAEFRLIRNQWRRSDPVCRGIDGGVPPELIFNVGDVGKEEDSKKTPFNYVLPEGIKQEELFGTFSQVRQDEKSLTINFEGLTDSCEVAMYKLTELDARLFKRLQMFVHAEDKAGAEIQDGDLSLFIRLGKDFVNHYYEYEIPLTMSRPDVPAGGTPSEVVWRAENFLDFPLSLFTELKKERNVSGGPLTEEFGRAYNQLITLVEEEIDPDKDRHILNIKGNPNLGQIKGIQIGVKVSKGVEGPTQGFCGSVWVNELRANGLEERGGYAGLARMDIQLADLGSLSASGGYSSVGWGALDQKLADRSLDEFIDYDLAANFELGKFTPSTWGLSVPFYAQYSKSIRNPKYDPYDLDLDVREKLDIAADQEERDLIKDRAQEVSTIRTVNFTNVRKTRQGKKGSAKPWDVENLSASYAFTEVDRRDPILKEDNSKDYRVGLNYNYAAKGYSIQPFKNLVKSKYLKFIKELNFNPVPSSFSFGSEVRRFKSQRTFREPAIPVFQFNDRRFDWVREYDLKWDLTKALKLSFTAMNQSVIDEYRQIGIAGDPADREWVNERGENVTDKVNSGGSDAVSKYWKDNLKSGGRVKDYNHKLGLTYNVPFKNFPGLDWVTAKAQYRADYAWTAGALISIDTDGNGPGNVIQNSQDRSLTAGFNLEKLYEKIGYFKRLEGKSSKKSSRRKRSVRDNKNELSADGGNKKTEKQDRKKDEGGGASFAEKLLLRPLLSLRKVDLTYREDYSTVIPGFLGEPELLGLSSGFDSPGWDFVGGFQPDLRLDNEGRNNWLFNAADQNWLNSSSAFNQQILQNKAKNYEAKVKVEPWKDVKIDVNFKKNYSTNHSENFRYKEQEFGDFRQLALSDIGSFEYTYFSLPTLFNDTDDGLKELFATFENNRTIISSRLPNINNPGGHIIDGEEYKEGHGALSSEVLIPAFLAAYTNGDPNSVLLDLESEVSKTSFIPKPNWKLTYNGLSKLDMFKDIFSSFSVEHGYSNTLRVSRFNTDPEFDGGRPFAGVKQNGNYFSRIEIPEVVIQERFDPIIGIKVKTKNDANFGVAYRKSRTLGLSSIAKTVDEQRNTELSFELGYTFRNVNIAFLTKDSGKKKRKNRKDKDDEEKDEKDSQVDKNRKNNRRGVINTRGRDLVFNFDFAFSDNVSYVHRIDQGKSAEPTRGLQSLRISPSVDYEVNENFTLRMFVEYSKTKPRLSTSFPITSILGGLTMRFNLN